MPRRRWNLSRLTSRAIQVILFVAWIALVVWKILTFISKPTGSETHFERDYQRPYLTICPSSGLSVRADQYIYPSHHQGTTQQHENYTTEQYENFTTRQYGNYKTLLDIFKYAGYLQPEMFHFGALIHLEEGDTFDYKDLPYENGKLMPKVNYALGGLCATYETPKDVSRTRFKLKEELKPRVSAAAEYLPGTWNVYGSITSRPSYVLFVHKLDDFWGGSDEHFTESDWEMETFWISNDTGQQELIINTEREIVPNLSRQPCEEDPNYSRSSCWRDRFLDTLNCSLLEGDNNSGKPTCTAADYFYFQYQYNFYIYGHTFGHLEFPCSSCPRRPCVVDRYTLSTRSAAYNSRGYRLNLHVSFSPVKRTVRTYFTYELIDLLADIGGFVGLLLGYSLYSVFDDLKALVIRLFSRRAATAPADPPAEIGGNVLTFSIKIDPAKGKTNRETKNK